MDLHGPESAPPPETRTPHILIRLLAYMNLFMGTIALICLVPIGVFALVTENREAQRIGLTVGGLLSVYLLMYYVSGIGLLRRRPWSRWVTLVLAGLLGVEAVVHVIRGEWGVVLFCAAYAAFAAWLLVFPAWKGYFLEGPAE